MFRHVVNRILTSSRVITKCTRSNYLTSGHMVWCGFWRKRCNSTHSLSRN